MYPVCERTIARLAQQGYEYDSDLHNDDEPYLLIPEAGSIIEIPAGMKALGMWLSSVVHAVHRFSTTSRHLKVFGSRQCLR